MPEPGGKPLSTTIAEELGDPSVIARERIALIVAELGERTARVLAERALRAAGSSSSDGRTSASSLFLEFAGEALPATARARISAHRSRAADFRNQSTIPAPRSAAPKRAEENEGSGAGRDDDERNSDLDGARVSVLEAMAGLSAVDQRVLLSKLLADID